MNIYTLYWIRHQSHKDVTKEGYVGITNRDANVRFNEHKDSKSRVGNAIRKYEDDTVVEVIKENLTEVDAKYLEEWFRPKTKIGWNITKGGNLPPSNLGKKCPETSNRMRGENNIAKRSDVRIKISQNLRGKPRYSTRGRKRPDHSKKMKSLRGKSYPKYLGSFVTPWGVFDSSKDAIDACNTQINITTLYRWCKTNNEKVISNQAISASEYLLTVRENIKGLTFKQIGFGFNPI